ncbi:MAG: FAD-dependent oxidoreductase [Muribaculaceae bacterium]|nr:FAD-dependent oxidoreductase [Muribaculaceae bacterium]
MKQVQNDNSSCGLPTRVAIIGAGPAGCICAKYLLEAGVDVTLFDKGKFLRTILPTGGGRCNLAHAEYDFRELAKNFPRGEKFLYSVFSRFSTADTLEFFDSIGIKTYTQDDNRIFPTSDSAAEVREKLLKSLSKCKFIEEKVLNIIPPLPAALPPKMGQISHLTAYARNLRKDMTPQENKLWLRIKKQQLGVKFRRQHTIHDKYIADFACVDKKIIVEIDGSQHIDSDKDKTRTNYLQNIGFRVIRFYNNEIDNNIEGCLEHLQNIINTPIAPFQGEMPQAKGVKFKIITENKSYTFDNVVIAIGGHSNFTMLKNIGLNIIPPTQALVGLVTKEDFSDIAGVSIKDILFTHKGVSGPYVYKISSINARKEMPYNLSFELAELQDFQKELNANPHKEIKNLLGQFIPKALAVWILNSLNINTETPCHKIDGRTRDKIINKVEKFEVTVTGKVRDGEVVTCGGVDLREIDQKTMECKKLTGLYFCGEVLDIDGFCGGFNLQNCWSTGFIAAESIINNFML